MATGHVSNCKYEFILTTVSMVLTQACRTEYKLTHMYEYILTTSLLYTILRMSTKLNSQVLIQALY